MKYIFNKKFVTVVMLLVLIIAAFANRLYTNDAEKTAKILGEAAYVNNDVKIQEVDEIKKTITAREKARDETKEMLQEIINNHNTTEEGRQQAEHELITLAKNIKNEIDCETILKQKGFKNVVVTISSDTASVLVDVKDLMNTEIAQITETVSTVSGLNVDKIKILSSD